MSEKSGVVIRDRNTTAAIAYVFGWVSGLLLMLLSKDEYVKFHAAQSLVIFGLVTAVVKVPFVGWALAPFLAIVAFVLWLVLIIKAYKGEKWEAPLFGGWAKWLLGKVGK